jgi:glutamyl-tRNA synthetase
MIPIVRTRIAPTPSGYLHIGNACNFLLTEKLVQTMNGSLRLRIDDLDAPRVRPEYIADIFDTLHWLGIEPDEGPVDADGHRAHYSQQTRLQDYDAMLGQLAATGKVFACTCSRADIAQLDADGQYPGSCRDKGLPLDSKNAAWRFRTDQGDTAAWQDGICGAQQVSLYQRQRDFVIRRRDGLPAYQVASLSDDIAYGINMIVRGIDLIDSTAAQLHLAAALEITPFLQCRFYHHPLLQNEAGEKLSKSAGSSSLKAMREAGVSGEDIRQIAAAWYAPFLPMEP